MMLQIDTQCLSLKSRKCKVPSLMQIFRQKNCAGISGLGLKKGVQVLRLVMTEPTSTKSSQPFRLTHPKHSAVDQVLYVFMFSCNCRSVKLA